jgi:hypothetical protein
VSQESYSGVTESHLVIDGDVRVTGVLSQGATVLGHLRLIGVCSGGLNVSEGGRAEVVGVLNGDLTIDSGAVVLVRGILHGAVRQEDGGRLLAAVRAVIGTEALGADGVLRRPSTAVTASSSAPIFERSMDGDWSPYEALATFP